jgi:hypothetical protein
VADDSAAPGAGWMRDPSGNPGDKPSGDGTGCERAAREDGLRRQDDIRSERRVARQACAARTMTNTSMT